MEIASSTNNKWINIISVILILFGLYLTSFYNYLLFHSIAEVFIIVVACGIFILAWNSRKFLDNNYLLFIGVAYLFIAVLELIHTLGYAGMGIFKEYGANLPTQFWIAARYMESFSLLIAPLLFGRRLKINILFIVYTSVTSLILLSIFLWNIFPICFVEGTGLTPFKKISEYIISLIYIGSIALLFQKQKEFEVGVYRLLIASIVLSIAAELAFTFYIHVYGLSNLIGHYFTIISFYFVYKAIIETGLVKPHALLFRNLKQSEESLRKSEEKYRSMMEAMKDAAYICSPELRIDYMNPTMVDKVGRDATGEICHKAIYDRDEKCSWCVLDQVQHGKHVDYEVANPRDNRCYSMTNSPIYHSAGNNSKLIILRDITERKTIEAQLRQAQKMEAIGSLAGGIAHEFNNILTTIIGNTQLAIDDTPEMNPVREFLDEIKSSSSRAKDVVRQLLGFARKSVFQLQPVHLSPVIKETMILIRASVPAAIEIRQNLSCKSDTVMADSTQISQVLINLCANAKNAM